MRPMRRQDRAVTDPEKIRAVIDACEVCRLGFQDGRGVYVVPVNFGHAVEDGRHVFYFHGAAEGPIRVVEDPSEKRRGLAAIMRQSTEKADWTFPAGAVDAVCVLRLEAEELSCKEHL